MQEETFEVRDLRHQDWVWTSKNLLFHKKIDEKMYKVYSGLAAYANNTTQKAYPGITTLVEKLHMGRNTVIRAIQKLEQGNFIFVERVTGKSNTYTLLEIESSGQEEKPKKPKIEVTPPMYSTKEFFTGVQNLRDKKQTIEATKVRDFLIALHEKYPVATKELIWSEINKFERYWTEKNITGTKERWQKQDTFEVDRRLVTWFSKKDGFKKVDNTNNKKRIV